AEGRLKILEIHSRKMRKDEDVDLAEIATETEEASGADLKAIMVEAGMNALRRRASSVSRSDFDAAIGKVLGDEIQGSEESMRMFS
ncbi:MAG: peptidase, partial [Methanothrix sp.]